MQVMETSTKNNLGYQHKIKGKDLMLEAIESMNFKYFTMSKGHVCSPCLGNSLCQWFTTSRAWYVLVAHHVWDMACLFHHVWGMTCVKCCSLVPSYFRYPFLMSGLREGFILISGLSRQSFKLLTMNALQSLMMNALQSFSRKAFKKLIKDCF